MSDVRCTCFSAHNKVKKLILFVSECNAYTNLPVIRSKKITCYIPEYCTGIDCCVDVSNVGQTFKAFALLDACKNRMTVGVEKLKKEVMLFDYDFGEFRD